MRDWLWPSSLIGILLLATDASFHNKSPTPCLSSCQGIFFLNCMWGASYGVNISLSPSPPLSLSLALSCFSPTACILKSIPNANGREKTAGYVGKALLCEGGKCQLSFIGIAVYGLCLVFDCFRFRSARFLPGCLASFCVISCSFGIFKKKW